MRRRGGSGRGEAGGSDRQTFVTLKVALSDDRYPPPLSLSCVGGRGAGRQTIVTLLIAYCPCLKRFKKDEMDEDELAAEEEREKAALALALAAEEGDNADGGKEVKPDVDDQLAKLYDRIQHLSFVLDNCKAPQ